MLSRHIRYNFIPQKRRDDFLDYHDLYIKMFGGTADAVETLDTTIDELVALRKKLILAQREAENAVTAADEDAGQAE